MMQDKDFLGPWSWAVTSQYVVAFPLFLITLSGGKSTEWAGAITVDAHSIPAIGLPIDLVVSSLVLVATLIYARQRASAPWPGRVPMLHLSATALDGAGRWRSIGKFIMFVVAHVGPAVLIAQMCHRYATGSAFVHDGIAGAAAIQGPGWAFLQWPDPLPADMRFGHANGLTHRAWMPFLYLPLVAGYASLLVATVRAVFRAAPVLPAAGTTVSAAAAAPAQEMVPAAAGSAVIPPVEPKGE